MEWTFLHYAASYNEQVTGNETESNLCLMA